MLVYSNRRGMPHDINIYFDRDNKYPFMVATIERNALFKSLEGVVSFLEKEGFCSAINAKMIAEKIHKKISECQYFPGRKCRGCEYSSDSDLYDGCCLYGKNKP